MRSWNSGDQGRRRAAPAAAAAMGREGGRGRAAPQRSDASSPGAGNRAGGGWVKVELQLQHGSSLNCNCGQQCRRAGSPDAVGHRRRGRLSRGADVRPRHARRRGPSRDGDHPRARQDHGQGPHPQRPEGRLHGGGARAARSPSRGAWRGDAPHRRSWPSTRANSTSRRARSSPRTSSGARRAPRPPPRTRAAPRRFVSNGRTVSDSHKIEDLPTSNLNDGEAAAPKVPDDGDDELYVSDIGCGSVACTQGADQGCAVM